VLNGTALPGPRDGRAPEPPPDAFGRLWTHLEALPAAQACEANLALVETFINLLASLIGTSLTQRLLKPVWEPGTADHTREDAP